MTARSTPVHETHALLCDFEEDVFVARMWHAGFDDNTDVFAMLWRKRDDAGWQHRIRFRYDEGTADPFDGVDDKRCFRGVIEPNEPIAVSTETLYRGLDAHFDHLCSTAPADCISKDTIVVEVWGGDAMRVLTRQPWAHISWPSPEQEKR